MIRLAQFILGTQQPQEALNFYTNELGMQLISTRQNQQQIVYELAFGENTSTASLILQYQKEKSTSITYQQQPNDDYWKYSLFVNDIKRVYQILKSKEHPTKEAYQFGEIGYLMHTQDAENYQIEFIQKTFEQHGVQNRQEDNKLPLLEQPEMGLITLRTKDPVKTIHFYEQFLGMQLMVRMYVERGNGFTLYFLADKSLQPPNADIDAIENREWMYQQKATFIELQHYWGSEHQPGFELQNKANSVQGFKGLRFATDDFQETARHFAGNNLPHSVHTNKLNNQAELHLVSPDGYMIYVY